MCGPTSRPCRTECVNHCVGFRVSSESIADFARLAGGDGGGAAYPAQEASGEHAAGARRPAAAKARGRAAGEGAAVERGGLRRAPPPPPSPGGIAGSAGEQGLETGPPPGAALRHGSACRH